MPEESVKRVQASALLLIVGLSACIQVYPPATPAPKAGSDGDSSATPSTATPSSGGSDADKDDPFKKWADVLKSTTEVSGFLTVHKKRDNTVYFEIAPDKLETDFGLVMHFSRGTGVFDMHDGLPLSTTQLMRFSRVGDQVQLIHRNTRFTADAGSPMRASLDDNVAHSVAAAFKVESENKENGHVLVDATSFLASDYSALTRVLRAYYGAQPISLDQDRSYVGDVMGFPRNTEIDAELTYRASGVPVAGGEAIPDVRSVPVGVRYSFFALPDTPMQPRLADDRMGHFMDAVKDFSRDRDSDLFVRYVNRWRLEKTDHSVAVSDPVQPIVYYIDRSVPHEYRQYVKEGIEAWNKAFETAGISNAIVAREAPADSTWSAEDLRYSTVRWTAAHQMGYAIGPSQSDPRTGEILNADVLISSSFVQGWLYEYQQIAGPAELRKRFEDMNRLRSELPADIAQRLCTAASGKQQQLGLQHAFLAAIGEVEPGEGLPEEYLGDAIRDLIMHEVGHTLGLRHNFKASSGIPHAKLNDKAFTRTNGLTLSVMDYGAVNISPNRAQQGFYWNKEVGKYDQWVIQYAYAPIYQQSSRGALATTGVVVATPELEVVGLQKIASQGSDPLHAYGTDEDTWLGTFAIDPRSSAWELGSDPVAFARDRVMLIQEVMPTLERRLIGVGDGYQRLRGAMTGMFAERLNATIPVTKVIGGVYVSRAHKGDPDGPMPFIPIPASEQRAAVQFLIDNVFAEEAFAIDASMVNKLAPNRWSDWGAPILSIPLDYPVHDWVALVQDVMLYNVLDAFRLKRMIDNEVRMPRGESAYTVSEMFGTLTDAVWLETGLASGNVRSINSFRRNLQRSYANELVLLMTGGFVVPEDVRSIARFELKRLDAGLDAAMTSSDLDRMTEAHLDETKERITQALEADMVRVIR
jgi:hypothetical protein